MEINVKLEEIFVSEGQNIYEVIREDIVRSCVDQIMDYQFKESFSKTIGNLVRERSIKKIDELIESLLDYEFTPTNDYGQTQNTTTLRNRIIEAFSKNCIYKKSEWHSDENAFTKMTNKLLEKAISEFSDQFSKEISYEFKSKCVDVAVQKLKKSFELKASALRS